MILGTVSQKILEAVAGYILWPDSYIRIPTWYTNEESIGFDLSSLFKGCQSPWAFYPLLIVVASALFLVRRSSRPRVQQI